jgi:hypothetical protein
MGQNARILAAERFDQTKLAAEWVSWVANGVKTSPEAKETA